MREGPCLCPNYPARPGPVYDSFSRSSQAFGAPFLSDDIPTLRGILAENRAVAMVSLSAVVQRADWTPIGAATC